MREAADALLAMISEILDFATLDADTLLLAEAPFDFAAELAPVCERAARETARKGVRFESWVQPGVSWTLRGDAARVRQVLRNVIGNAVKFTARGRVRVEVAQRDAPAPWTAIEVRVTDSGIGIAPAQLARLFEPFAPGDASTTRRHGGTGLGLAVARRLVERMGGEIAVQSEPGHGSVFVFTLQLSRCAAPVAPRRGAVPGTGGPRRLLVAEDNPVNQRVAARLLRALGYEVDVVSDGAQAAAALARGDYAAVLMDCMMPEMDGYAATAAVRQREGDDRHTPIIGVTANAMAGDRERCLAAGMDDYVAKPVTAETLRAALGRCVDDVAAGTGASEVSGSG